jgi:uncharacterized OB-fold protein
MSDDKPMTHRQAQGILWKNRGKIREVACPKCGAEPRMLCIRNGRRVEQNHRERAGVAVSASRF